MEKKIYGTFKTNYTLGVGGKDNYRYPQLESEKVRIPLTTGNKSLDLSLCNLVGDEKSKYDLTITLREITTKDGNKFDIFLLLVEFTSSSTTIFVDLQANTEDSTAKIIFKSFLAAECTEDNLLHEGN